MLSLLVGVRTEEARALRWDHVDLDGDLDAEPPVPPHVDVWRSVRAHGDVKTARSRRTLQLPAMAVEALRAHKEAQGKDRAEMEPIGQWQDSELVFTTSMGKPLDAANVRRCRAEGLRTTEWIIDHPQQTLPEDPRKAYRKNFLLMVTAFAAVSVPNIVLQAVSLAFSLSSLAASADEMPVAFGVIIQVVGVLRLAAAAMGAMFIRAIRRTIVRNLAGLDAMDDIGWPPSSLRRELLPDENGESRS